VSNTKIIMLVVLGIFILVPMSFGLEWAGLEWQGFFSQKQANIEHKVFKETRTFNEAKLQELVKYRLEYMKSKDNIEKNAIASTVRMAFADYDEKRLDSVELRTFLSKMKYGN